MNENWWGWLAVIIVFAIVQAWRVLIRSVKSADTSGMARLNAAAERILKERQGAASAAANPPRSKATSATRPVRHPTAAGAKPRHASLLPKSTTPAVIRRDGILGGREPVVQRRR